MLVMLFITLVILVCYNSHAHVSYHISPLGRYQFHTHASRHLVFLVAIIVESNVIPVVLAIVIISTTLRDNQILGPEYI